jgi:ethanolamine phosphate phosphodiesterase
VLIADPQLVDPHTYPGRPWPLSSLTIAYTDLYLRRSYTYLQQYLQPDTLFFLGDLFDGGREWGTWHSSSPEEQFRRYGNKYWMKEYTRFQRIYIDRWLDSQHESPAEPRGRKIIASLPGNHDLGFASGIQLPVKERFEAYFGNGNRIDIIGNHSFVSVDTVSLSAMDQADPNTGGSGIGDGTSSSAANRDIWGSTEEFLAGVRQARNRAVKRELRNLAGLHEQSYGDDGLVGFAPNITDLTQQRKPVELSDHLLKNAEKSFPSILLTHVPLYRAPDTDCGAQRERGKAILVQGGYQYQNVLTPLISKDIISKLGVEDVAQIYSGDDHDYCEIEHGEFTGRIKEITVKSISLAMGVRKPGFLAVSLHNPVDVRPTANIGEQETGVKRDTIQNHLCLLPDQLTIFVRYGILLLLTLLVLAIRTVMTPSMIIHDSESGKPLLPLVREKAPPFSNGTLFRHAVASSFSSSSSDQAISGNGVVSAHRTPRSTSPKMGGYGNLPLASRSSSPSKAKLDAAFAPARGANVISMADGDDDDDRWGMPPGNRRALGKQRRRGIVVEFGHAVARVAVPVLGFYVWLVRRG